MKNIRNSISLFQCLTGQASSLEGYVSKASCENGIASVRENAKNASAFEQKRSKDEKFYFSLKATNGQVVGTSEMYNTAAPMENGIQSVMENAPDAIVER